MTTKLDKVKEITEELIKALNTISRKNQNHKQEIMQALEITLAHYYEGMRQIAINLEDVRLFTENKNHPYWEWKENNKELDPGYEFHQSDEKTEKGFKLN